MIIFKCDIAIHSVNYEFLFAFSPSVCANMFSDKRMFFCYLHCVAPLTPQDVSYV